MPDQGDAWKRKYVGLKNQFKEKIEEWKDFKRKYEAAVQTKKMRLSSGLSPEEISIIDKSEHSTQDTDATVGTNVYNKERVFDTYLDLDEILEMNKKDFEEVKPSKELEYVNIVRKKDNGKKMHGSECPCCTAVTGM